jgi:hypothetical protein
MLQIDHRVSPLMAITAGSAAGVLALKMDGASGARPAGAAFQPGGGCDRSGGNTSAVVAPPSAGAGVIIATSA